VVSQSGKEATITLISSGDFVGESALAAIPGLRLSTATALGKCTALKITREEMIRVMHQEQHIGVRIPDGQPNNYFNINNIQSKSLSRRGHLSLLPDCPCADGLSHCTVIVKLVDVVIVGLAESVPLTVKV
jgi:CRP-like cAMP-binding protein